MFFAYLHPSTEEDVRHNQNSSSASSSESEDEHVRSQPAPKRSRRQHQPPSAPSLAAHQTLPHAQEIRNLIREELASAQLMAPTAISTAPMPSPHLQEVMPSNQQCSGMQSIYSNIPHQSTLGSLSLLPPISEKLLSDIKNQPYMDLNSLLPNALFDPGEGMYSNRRDLLISSLQNGFNIGYAGPHFTLISKNWKSAYDYPDALSQNILIELQEDRIAGPFREPPLLNFRTSPIGIIPKKEPNKFRTITDLSSPAGKSINDFIPSSESAAQFNHFDKAVEIVAKLGQGNLMAKLDIKSAFRLCAVRKSDWHLLGFSFPNLYFVDLCLPFGLRSSVNRFTQLADAVLWFLQNNYNIVNSINYLDDYFLASLARRKTCSEHLDCAMNVFSNLGFL